MKRKEKIKTLRIEIRTPSKEEQRFAARCEIVDPRDPSKFTHCFPTGYGPDEVSAIKAAVSWYFDELAKAETEPSPIKISTPHLVN